MEDSRVELAVSNSKECTYLSNKIKIKLHSDWEAYNYLIKALRCGQKDLAQFLILNGSPVNMDPAIRLFTPLHLAVMLRCPLIVKLLLDKGADINAKNNNLETPLMMSAKMGDGLITNYLLSVSDQKNCSNRENLTHMHIACMKNCVSVVKNLVKQGARINHAVKIDSLFWPGFTPLHFAVQYKSTEKVEFLLNCGADITAKDAKNLTPLHYASLLHYEKIIDLLLSFHQYETSNPINSEGLSHFHIACTRNNPTVVEQFLRQGVNVNIQINKHSLNWPNYRPIHFAIVYECFDVIKLLLSYNAVLKTDEIHIINPIQLAYKTANSELIDLLLSKSSINKSDIKEMKQLLDFYDANKQENVNECEEITCRFLDKYSVNSVLPFWPGCTPLHFAVKNKCVKAVKILLRKGASITAKDLRGKTSLHLAFESKQMNIMDMILSAHSNITENPVDNNGLSHFHISCISKNLQLIKNFLNSNVNINDSVHIDSSFWPGCTALHFAVAFQLDEVVQLLLENGADITVKNGNELTPLDVAMSNIDSNKIWLDEIENTVAIIDSILLIKCNKRIDSFDDRGLSSLHTACIKGNTTIIEDLLCSSPDLINKAINWPKSDWSGYTPLHFAVRFNNYEATELLMNRGADISIRNGDGNTPLHEAFSLRFQLIKIENPRLFFTENNFIGDEGYSHFHIACNIGNLEAVQHFIDQGVNVNEPSKFTGVFEYNGQTPLHSAIDNIKVCKKIVHLLLNNGADINARDAELNTPLHYTKENYGWEIAKILLSNGADINAQNMYNETPLYSICYDSDFIDFNVVPDKIQFFLEHGADVNIENEKGHIPFSIIKKWPDSVAFKVLCAAIMMKHIKKLKIINSYVSMKNEQIYFILLAHCEAEGVYKETDFTQQCLKELQQLSHVSLDNYTTLRDVLFKNSNAMALHCENETFQEIIRSTDIDGHFPIYGSLLKLQFKKGLTRRPLLQMAKVSINFLIGISLPDACSEKILCYLSNEDLKKVILCKENI